MNLSLPVMGSGMSTTFVKLILPLRIPDLWWVLRLVWENIAPAGLAGIIVWLLALGPRYGHTQDFACNTKLIELPHTKRMTNLMDYKHPLPHVRSFSEGGK
jgi:hypothetical protein